MLDSHHVTWPRANRERLFGGALISLSLGLMFVGRPVNAQPPKAAVAEDLAAKLPAKFTNVRWLKNVPYANTENPRQQLDLFLPASLASSKPTAVIAHIHGGAWRAGKKSSRRVVRRLAELVQDHGYAGVTIGYRLSDEAVWPAQIHDCKAAIRWIRANAKRYNLDPERIGVFGESAGGHLVSMLGMTGDVPSLNGRLGPYPDVSSRVACVINEYGPSELLTMGDYPSRIDHNAPGSPESQLVGGPIQQHRPAARSASPTSHASADDAPMLIIHGDQDPLVPFNQSVRLKAVLTGVGVNCRFIKVSDGGHGRFNSPELSRRRDAFFAHYLHDQPANISTEPVPVGSDNKAASK